LPGDKETRNKNKWYATASNKIHVIVDNNKPNIVEVSSRSRSIESEIKEHAN